MLEATRSLRITAELLRAYSRRGNFHSDPAAAREMGLDALVAQGLQVAGPAYGLLLDEWGEDFLAGGEVELKFVGRVVEGDTVDARVAIDDDSATIEVTNAGRTAVVGTAARMASRAAGGTSR
jgi:acyl dehydratase